MLLKHVTKLAQQSFQELSPRLLNSDLLVHTEFGSISSMRLSKSQPLTFVRPGKPDKTTSMGKGGEGGVQRRQVSHIVNMALILQFQLDTGLEEVLPLFFAGFQTMSLEWRVQCVHTTLWQELRARRSLKALLATPTTMPMKRTSPSSTSSLESQPR